MKTIAERLAELVAAAVIIFGAGYILSHAFEAWLRGAFQVVTR